MVSIELLAFLSVLFGFGKYAYSTAKAHDRPVMSVAGFFMALISAAVIVLFIAMKMITKS